ncbi:Uncharacterised protein [Bordetella pertussis]|nr:Uncharacterised protein [Bordetella pertussis]
MPWALLSSSRWMSSADQAAGSPTGTVSRPASSSSRTLS